MQTIVWVHGFPLSPAVFDEQRAIPGIRHLVPALPGFGGTPALPGEPSIDDYARFVLAGLDREGIERATFAGLSMGGYICFSIYRLAPERVERLILIDTRETADSEEARRGRYESIAKVEREGIAPIVEGMLPKMLHPHAPPPLRERVRKIMESSSPEGVIAALRAMATRADSSELLPQITVPTLILVGESDQITPVADAQRMADAIRGATLQILPRAGHLSNLERHATVEFAVSIFTQANPKAMMLQGKRGLAEALLRRGRWEEAWKLCDQLVEMWRESPQQNWPRVLQLRWTGASMEGKRALVRCDRGLGDTLQYARYLPRLASEASELTVAVQKPLLPLLSLVPGIGRLIPIREEPEPEHDATIEIMELGHYYRLTPATVGPPLAIPLESPPRDDDRRLRVGCFWQGGEWDSRRNVPFEAIRQITTGSEARFFALQLDLDPEECGEVMEIVDDRLNILSTARFMKTLDLVVTLDSMSAHLAGTLGVPVWILLPKSPDGRWLEGRADSPWYPSMRIFQQRDDRGWQPVIDEVREALRLLEQSRAV